MKHELLNIPIKALILQNGEAWKDLETVKKLRNTCYKTAFLPFFQHFPSRTRPPHFRMLNKVVNKLTVIVFIKVYKMYKLEKGCF